MISGPTNPAPCKQFSQFAPSLTIEKPILINWTLALDLHSLHFFFFFLGSILDHLIPFLKITCKLVQFLRKVWKKLKQTHKRTKNNTLTRINLFWLDFEYYQENHIKCLDISSDIKNDNELFLLVSLHFSK